jgi:hypothetical protein
MRYRYKPGWIGPGMKKPPAPRKSRAKPKAPGPKKGWKRRLRKYNAKGREEDGRWFDSGYEADRYLQLKALLQEGRIERLEFQPTYPVNIDGVHICNYRADFQYFKRTNGKVEAHIIEDVKGFPTPVYRLKRKLVAARYKRPVIELPAGWLAHYQGKTADECEPIIKQLNKERNARRKAKRARLDEDE